MTRKQILSSWDIVRYPRMTSLIISSHRKSISGLSGLSKRSTNTSSLISLSLIKSVELVSNLIVPQKIPDNKLNSKALPRKKFHSSSQMLKVAKSRRHLWKRIRKKWSISTPRHREPTKALQSQVLCLVCATQRNKWTKNNTDNNMQHKIYKTHNKIPTRGT